MIIILLDLLQEMREAILEKVKIKNLRIKIYLMVITLDLNLIEDNTEEVYNQEKYLSEIFYFNLNKIENPTYDGDDRENIDFENSGNE